MGSICTQFTQMRQIEHLEANICCGCATNQYLIPEDIKFFSEKPSATILLKEFDDEICSFVEGHIKYPDWAI